ncbi:MAG: hypothetical protein F6J90_13355 [Moorea sp. SIOASIH]|nr:hypothetical protein [Moorena sp. SIOASIH]
MRNALIGFQIVHETQGCVLMQSASGGNPREATESFSDHTKKSSNLFLTIPCSLLPAPCSLLPAPCSLLPAPCSLFPIPCSLFKTYS